MRLHAHSQPINQLLHMREETQPSHCQLLFCWERTLQPLLPRLLTCIWEMASWICIWLTALKQPSLSPALLISLVSSSVLTVHHFCKLQLLCLPPNSSVFLRTFVCMGMMQQINNASTIRTTSTVNLNFPNQAPQWPIFKSCQSHDPSSLPELYLTSC